MKILRFQVFVAQRIHFSLNLTMYNIFFTGLNTLAWSKGIALKKLYCKEILAVSLRGLAIHSIFQCCHSVICWLVFIILHRDIVKINEIEFVKYFISSNAIPASWTFRSLIIPKLYLARTLKLLVESLKCCTLSLLSG